MYRNIKLNQNLHTGYNVSTHEHIPLLFHEYVNMNMNEAPLHEPYNDLDVVLNKNL